MRDAPGLAFRIAGVLSFLVALPAAAQTNLLPVVSLTSPVEGAIFDTGSTVPLAAAASDADGWIERVEFYANGQCLGQSTNAPYALAWSNVPQGLYQLTAAAIDDLGAAATSAPVNIVVRPLSTNDFVVSQLSNKVHCACGMATFSVMATGCPPYRYIWRCNGWAIPGATNSTVTLISLKPEDAGVYSVEVTSPCGSVTRSASLTLLGGGNRNPVMFTNPEPIYIPYQGPASPYPSLIKVACVPGVVQSVTARLFGLSHSWPDDLDILLVSPTGLALKLMSDAGGNRANALAGVDLAFSDIAAPLPDEQQIQSGMYRPSDYTPPAAPLDSFELPSPVEWITSLAGFQGIDPNGPWCLYVMDDSGGDRGEIAGGWSLEIEWQPVILRLSEPRVLPDGCFEVKVHGVSGLTHVLEGSTDLVRWVPVSTNVSPAPVFTVLDPEATNYTHRFYRATQCP